MNYLWSDEAQQAFVKFHFRSVTNDAFNDANAEFAKIEMPFTVQLFGGWDQGLPGRDREHFRQTGKKQPMSANVSGVKHTRGFDVIKPFSIGVIDRRDAAACSASVGLDIYFWDR